MAQQSLEMNWLDRERQAHLQLIRGATADRCRSSTDEGLLHNIKTTPIFSRGVRCALEDGEIVDQGEPPTNMFPQYGFLGVRDATFSSAGGHRHSPPGEVRDQDMLYTNMNAPWSAFICGSQGGGKSHTLSCMLENALLSDSVAGVLPNPLAGMIFHYDRFTSPQSTQFCEAAYLCSQGVPVKVLVSAVSLPTLRRLYANLPGLPLDAPRPVVEALYLSERQLNNTNMMKLMAVADGARTPLYLDVIKQILRDMALKKGGGAGLNYQEFKQKIKAANFTKDQSTPLNMRLNMLESFLNASADTRDIWNFEKGTLTIIDLSCSFVNENEACALFTICLGLFMEGRSKFLTQSGDALTFTNELIEAICQQRHIATRVFVATQEPTLSPRLLDLCSVAIVHRFRSPAWFETLKAHLAGAHQTKDGKSASDDVFRTIVGLKTGQALLFCPEAMLDIVEMESDGGITGKEIRELKDSFIQIRIRKRITADGGISVMASNTVQEPGPRHEGSKRPSLSGRSAFEQAGARDARENNSAQTGSDKDSTDGFFSGGSQFSGDADDSHEKPSHKIQSPSGLAARPKLQATSQKSKAAATFASSSSAHGKSLPVAPPFTPRRHEAPKGTANTSRIAACLKQHVERSLDLDTASLDFGVIRRAAEKDLQFEVGRLTKVDESGAIIKKACKKYLNEHSLPRPTWMNW